MRQNKIIPIEVNSESEEVITLQLAKTTIKNSNGENEDCPLICIYSECMKPQKSHIMLFNTSQVEKLIKQLIKLKKQALSYDK